MDDMFNTGWDPFGSLKANEHNIGQCVQAIQHGSEIMRDLAHRYNQQRAEIRELQHTVRLMQAHLALLQNQPQHK